VGTAPYAEILPTELQEQRVVPGSAQARAGTTYYGITDNQIDWDTQRGWFMPLDNVHETTASLRAGERSIAEVQNIGNSVMITTTVLRRASNAEMCSISDLPANYVYPFAVAYLPSGGFTRGVSVSSYYSRADGTPLSTTTLPTPGNTSDPYIDPDVTSRPMGVGADGEYAGGATAGVAACRNMRATILGTGEQPLEGGVSCPTTGWSRTQFQLSAPPSN
jgi:type IV pilus assembly protein PilY1